MNRIRWLVAVLFVVVISVGYKQQSSTERFVISIPSYFPRMPGGMVVTKKGAELGRFLFYDPILSADSTLSCSSCHKQEYAFSDGQQTFSKGLGGLQRRNTPPLFNLAWYPKLFWDGKANSLEEQIFHPVRQADEMNLSWEEASVRLERSSFYREKFHLLFGNKRIDSSLIANVIAQFEKTLVSCKSKYDRVLQGEDEFTPEEATGFVLVNDMTKGDCLHCHTTDSDPLGTTLGFSNNGLDTYTVVTSFMDRGRGGVTGGSYDVGKFKIPSLRNVAITAPYMHDGRFASLEQVLDFYSEGVNSCINVDSKMEFARNGGAHLSAIEKTSIIAFLKTLTDSVFIMDKNFSNPFLDEVRTK